MLEHLLLRCPWVDLGKPDYVRYHDEEWGVPVHDDRLLFEFLTLEAAQAGLSWYTILKKRENYRAAFDNFEPTAVALYGEEKVEELLADAGIVRNRAKIRSAILNARMFLEVQKEFGSFDAYIWGFVGGKPQVRHPRGLEDFRATSPESDALSRDMKKRGFKFLGSTVCYAHMQATGMVDDHAVSCFRKKSIPAQLPDRLKTFFVKDCEGESESASA